MAAVSADAAALIFPGTFCIFVDTFGNYHV